MTPRASIMIAALLAAAAEMVSVVKHHIDMLGGRVMHAN